MGLPQSQSDARFAARASPAQYRDPCVPAHRAAMQREPVRDGVLVRRRASQWGHAPPDRPEAPRRHQRGVYDEHSADSLIETAAKGGRGRQKAAMGYSAPLPPLFTYSLSLALGTLLV